MTRSHLWPALLPPSQHGRDDLCSVSAHGTRITYADGATRLCGSSGLWNVNLGYGDPTIAAAVAQAMTDASYLTLFRYENSYARRAADALVEYCGPDRYDRVVFSTSGGAANDLVMKLVRDYQEIAGRPRAKTVVGLEGSYHGLTYGSHGLSGDDLAQRRYLVDQRFVRHVPPNDVPALRTLVDRSASSLAAIVVEPVLGTGAVALTPEFIAELVDIRRRHGILLVADEVATGFGRTGRRFASESWPEPPDVLVVSKALTNGTAAAAAVLFSAEVAAAFEKIDAFTVHAETQAGTPPTCAAILATLDRSAELDSVAGANRISAALDTGLASLVADGTVTTTTGLGCFRGLEVAGPDGQVLPPGDVPALVRHVAAAGAVVHPSPRGVQLVPALVYTDDEVTELLAAVRQGISTYRGATVP